MNKQSGNARIAIIVVLVIVILGLLGFVFWQNFLNKPVVNTVDTTTQGITSMISQPNPDDVELTESAVIRHGESKETTMTFQYPKSWKYSRDTSTVTSADGKVSIFLTLTPPDGIGGTCDDPAETTTVIDPVVSMRWATMLDSPQSLFSAYITKAHTENDADGKYTYGFGAVRNTEEIKNIKAGQSACPLLLTAPYIDLGIPSEVTTLQAAVRFANLENNNIVKTNLSVADIETEFGSMNATVAESIVTSISIK